ncbi:hypothetical protein KVH27_19520 [Streptomyces olivaceus]|uniref:hypothetical protein n=1 Tax=Streptomyces olivaceus TaxID=47716 RepID=UPI001CCFED49|nr:hypothetical protein [Streptomyces olivaceus]MBZ6250558.1 hypothetical protein [Streptomyces olivaceus]
MNTRTAAAALAAAALLTLTACSSSSDEDTDAKPKATATPSDRAPEKSSIPPRPTGEKRQQLLDALAAAAPDIVRYEDKAIDAARNQCSAFGEGVKRPDWLASQRFTYKDVTTSEEQGKAINDALKSSGFCNV